MLGGVQVIRRVKKFNNKSYNTWATCMESYLQAQDVKEIVSGTEELPLPQDTNNVRRWKVKAEKAMAVF
ncbi:hypothetical protein L484_026970 [Morus notabilis]|uniref:DUF4219 domain-containing protein n=1 Tax=Morus notabilis TaxID=981085 RepID=W9R9B4_9ROSA|nr:hypothetical protein L484_026970 [Morus notabilis]